VAARVETIFDVSEKGGSGVEEFSRGRAVKARVENEQFPVNTLRRRATARSRTGASSGEERRTLGPRAN
jgi:hypothetical protein